MSIIPCIYRRGRVSPPDIRSTNFPVCAIPHPRHNILLSYETDYNTPNSNPENPEILKILVQTTKNPKKTKKSETDMKLIGYILFPSPEPLPSLLNTCYNTTTMKNRNRLHLICTTKTGTRHPKNVHPKTDQNQANKNVHKMKISNFSKTPINPVPYWYNPKNQNVHRNEKRPFCVRF